MSQQYKSYFDIPENISYLTTPGSGLISKEIKKWRSRYDVDFHMTDTVLREQQGAFIQQVKQTIADFAHTAASNIYCTPNFSHGFNVILNGLPADIRILLLNEDYPSVNFPVISRGFDHTFVNIDENMEQNILEAIRHYKPDVFICSIVQYISGIKIDLSFIQELKATHPDLLIIGDGTQYLGTESFDFETSGFDGIGTSGYKWLLSGFGNGFFILNDILKNKLYQTAQQQKPVFEKMWEGKSILQLYFEPGHVDTLAQGTLQKSLQFFDQLGIQNTAAYTSRLSEHAREEFVKRNLLTDIVKRRNNHSTIFNLQIDPNHFSTLMENGIKCFPRGTGIRIGFHLYNDTQDLERLLQVIDKLPR
ncbi:cysteine desulfurase family protein [Sphingobacterium spiritivorum]|uniref:Cysteine desulfurase family protein n=1 Tax=Sphingobacterium spiritivorum TaxID=258 RepID=A0A380BZ33_SPHSI|nr:aminotransferase class V-fold PLP-dependent enzyme [Sphingobacterium spiritivorum]SUJ08736.1 cysteine desulfurase family protein [Sphingobacterium spiritivorum]